MSPTVQGSAVVCSGQFTASLACQLTRLRHTAWHILDDFPKNRQTI